MLPDSKFVAEIRTPSLSQRLSRGVAPLDYLAFAQRRLTRRPRMHSAVNSSAACVRSSLPRSSLNTQVGPVGSRETYTRVPM